MGMKKRGIVDEFSVKWHAMELKRKVLILKTIQIKPVLSSSSDCLVGPAFVQSDGFAPSRSESL